MKENRNAQKYLTLLREIRDVAFATVSEDGKPQVRIIDVMIVEDEKLYFCTARGKDFYKQLTVSGQTAITGMTKSYQMIRLSGRVEKLENQKAWIDRIFEENPSMQDVYPGESRYILEAFCIQNGQGEFFDLGQQPIRRESFVIGNAALERKGFMIGDSCIGCGKCAAACPQRCITPGSPYVILQEHCLHCGLCFESCPVSAVERSIG